MCVEMKGHTNDSNEAVQSMRMPAFGTTSIGQRRERNEDAFLIDDELSIYVVCDGMGGHAAGECRSYQGDAVLG